MIDKSLQNKPIQTAQKLMSLLNNIKGQVVLSNDQQKALERDITSIERIMFMLNHANSLDDWQVLWQTVRDIRNFGGYVGYKQGQELEQLTNQLLLDILDSYREANKP